MRDGRDTKHRHKCITCCGGGCIWVEVDIRAGPIDTGVEVDIHSEGVGLMVRTDEFP